MPTEVNCSTEAYCISKKNVF